jgi:hypothetical protein
VTTDVGRLTGSREPSPDGLGPSGFDPERLPPRERELFDALDATWRTLRSLRLNSNTKMLVPPAQTLQRLGVVERRHGPGYLSLYRRTA